MTDDGWPTVAREDEVDHQKWDRHRTSAPQSPRSGCGASPLFMVQG